MTLREYLKEYGRQAALAADTGLPTAFVNQMARGVRPVPVIRCATIERATHGLVTRQELRPDDWHLIWPELVDKDQQPAAGALVEAPHRKDHITGRACRPVQVAS